MAAQQLVDRRRIFARQHVVEQRLARFPMQVNRAFADIRARGNVIDRDPFVAEALQQLGGHIQNFFRPRQARIEGLCRKGAGIVP